MQNFSKLIRFVEMGENLEAVAEADRLVSQGVPVKDFRHKGHKPWKRCVPPEVFVDTAVREEADIIGVSSLMPVCLPAINEIRRLVKDKGINPKIVAGGAAAQQAEREYLDVDYVAFDGLNYFLKM